MRKIYNKFLYAWYAYPYLFILLLPFTFIYRCIIFIRRKLYALGLFKTYRAPCPVIVVGNFMVGGTGKTPFVIALVQTLKNKGFKPGVLTRGYGSVKSTQNIFVTPLSAPRLVGDESVLIAQKTHVPIVKNKNRAKGAELLKEHCDVIISDDGLQHYALQADIKIALKSKAQGLRNFFCLPAGPWREPEKRISSVDFYIQPKTVIDEIVPLDKNCVRNTLDLSHLRDITVHAVCGIAAPWRFFAMLNALGVNTVNHAYPDHYALNQNDLTFPKNEIVLITEKDAVKCQDYNLPNVWVVKISIKLDDAFCLQLLNKLARLKVNYEK